MINLSKLFDFRNVQLCAQVAFDSVGFFFIAQRQIIFFRPGFRVHVRMSFARALVAAFALLALSYHLSGLQSIKYWNYRHTGDITQAQFLSVFKNILT